MEIEAVPVPELELELIEPVEVVNILGLKSTGVLRTWRSTKAKNLPWYKVGRAIKYARRDVEKFQKEYWFVRVEPWANTRRSRKARSAEVA